MKYIKKFESSTNLKNSIMFITNCIFTFGDIDKEYEDMIKLPIRKYVNIDFSVNGSEYHTTTLIDTYAVGNEIFVTVGMKDYGYGMYNSFDVYDFDSGLNYVAIELLQMVKDYDFQKEFLEEHPEKIKEVSKFGYADGIEDEFDHLINADDIGLL